MRTVITGGTGLIGRALARELIARGHEVVLLSRAPERARHLPPAARVERWDGRTAAGWGALADGATAIVNLAGASIGIPPVPWTAERKRRIRESRVRAGEAVVQAVQAAQQKPQVLIQASAVGYYGSRGDAELTEESPPGTDFLAGVCVDWESSTAAVEALGVRRVIIRSAVVLSHDGGLLPFMALPFRLFLGAPLGSGRQWFPWIHIADEVGAICFLIERQDARGPFNLSAPQQVTNLEFSRTLARVLGRPMLLRLPAPLLRLMLGELAELLLLGSQRVVPRRLLDLGFAFRFPQLEPALSDLLG
jgi:uncharacterized protein (TIGR01777 family)